jgi:hypothetical protein
LTGHIILERRGLKDDDETMKAKGKRECRKEAGARGATRWEGGITPPRVACVSLDIVRSQGNSRKGEEREANYLKEIEAIEDKIANERVTDAADSCDGRV